MISTIDYLSENGLPKKSPIHEILDEVEQVALESYREGRESGHADKIGDTEREFKSWFNKNFRE